jgi:predicted PurR-regulated permease PerM
MPKTSNKLQHRNSAQPEKATGNQHKPATPPRTIPEIMTLVAAVVALVVLGQSVSDIISPFVLLGAVLYLLYPFRELTIARRLMILAVALFALWFCYSILSILAPFVIAFLVAYILNPLVLALEKKKFPRWASALTVILVFVGVVVCAMLFVVPPAIEQFQGIIKGLNEIVQDFADLLNSGKVFEVLSRFGIPVESARHAITEQFSPRLETILKSLFEGVFGFVSGISSLVEQLINAIIIPFLVFYMLKDFPSITHRITTFVPLRSREGFIARAKKIDDLMGKYFRGAITVAVIQGTISAVGLWIIGVNYALVLGIMSGILDFIPYIGLLTSLVVSSIVALFSGGPVVAKVIAVVVMYLGQKVLEATVLAPKIIGSQVGLHPVLLILSLLVFGHFLGFVGLLIAVPLTALIMAGIEEWQVSRGLRDDGEPHQEA